MESLSKALYFIYISIKKYHFLSGIPTAKLRPLYSYNIAFISKKKKQSIISFRLQLPEKVRPVTFLHVFKHSVATVSKQNKKHVALLRPTYSVTHTNSSRHKAIDQITRVVQYFHRMFSLSCRQSKYIYIPAF